MSPELLLRDPGLRVTQLLEAVAKKDLSVSHRLTVMFNYVSPYYLIMVGVSFCDEYNVLHYDVYVHYIQYSMKAII